VSAPPAIELIAVEKHFGDAIAVHSTDLAIEQGEFFSLLGPSGCGKTTTLRMIAGLEQPTNGRIMMTGEDVTEIATHRREANMVFQNYALFPHLTVFENVAFGLRVRRLSGDEITTRVTNILDAVRLTGLGKRKPNQLSGGQQQRVALGRALVLNPKVLLLDEPLGALDQKLRKEMQFELKRLQREVGITFIYVTHDQEEALTMSDRIAVMNLGRVLQVDDSATLYDRPMTKFVADFIGTSNFLRGRLTGFSNGMAEVEIAVVGRVEVRSIGDHRVGDDVTLMVRPERLRMGPPSEGTSSTEGVVEDIIFVGNDVLYRVRLTDSTGLLVRCQNRGREARMAIHIGDNAGVSWEPGAATLVLD
jgi:spermidine/putrescine transport system ATP-binding protein